MLTSDKFRDECGVVAIYANPEAEKLAYLGLHALQHRGQESAGIVTSDGMTLHMHKAMGLVADIFQEAVLAKLPGTLAIGHTRYSTAGDSALLNAQPIMVQSNKGMMALAHNGNLVNAQDIRQRLESQGSIFQTNSDTEVIVHLIALSKEQTLPEAIADALRRVEGAFSLVMISPDRIFAARDPRGFRPLAMGRIPAHRWREAGHHRVCLGDLRVRSDRRHLRARCEAGGVDRGRSRRELRRGSILRRWRNRVASSSMFISRVPTAGCLAGRCRRAGRNWVGNWRAKRRPKPTSWFQCRTPV